MTRDTVGWLVRRYVESRTDVTEKAREQYRWAVTHIEAGLGAIRLDRLDREDVARWMDSIATAPEILLTVYAHTLPQATVSVTERIGARARASHS